MLTVTDLTKSFGTLLAVDHVSFDVKEGQVFGFLGPNGAGKTTTINMICNLLKPDSGSITLDGEDLTSGRAALRKKLGVVPQEIALYEELNAIENLNFWGSLYDLSASVLKRRVSDLLELAGLLDRAKDRVKTYSGGMKRRLNMMAGLLHKPKLLLLDEPTVGIDPQARHHILNTVRQIAKEGTTILYTTHYLDEAEDLCDRLAIIDHGRILTMGTQEQIVQIVGENSLIKISGDISERAIEELARTFDGLNIETLDDNQVVLSLPSKEHTGRLIEALIRSDIVLENLQIKEPSLDSVFIKLTGRELRD